MTKLQMKPLAAVSIAALGMLGFTSMAHATTPIYGGGSSLVAPFLRQSGDCYGNKTALVKRGATSTSPTLQVYPSFNYTGTPAMNCATTHVDTNTTIKYISTGSGIGIDGFFSHDPSFWGDTQPGHSPSPWPEVHYGASDAGLGTAEVTVYNSGGTVKDVTVVAPGNAAIPAGCTSHCTAYANPKEKFGAMVQMPLLVAPVTIAFDPVYKKVRNGDNSVTEYRFHLKYPRADGSGGLRLNAATYCKIFNGKITDWNDPALKALNGGQSLRDPADPTPDGSWSVPMQMVGRFDGSGTTSIWTRHLAAVCGSTSGNQYADGGTTLPATLQGPHYDKSQANTGTTGETLGKYTLADGNDGVAKYLDFTTAPGNNAGDSVTQGRIGYVGPDFALPYVINTGANTYGLVTATLLNSSGKWIAPTSATAAIAFGSLTPPQSLANGHYDPNSTDTRSRANPQDWVASVHPTEALANPTAAGGYPIVGTTDGLFYSCYARPADATAVKAYLDWYFTSHVTSDKTHGLIGLAGLSPLPGPWAVAIRETFLNNSSHLNLFINRKGAGQCRTPGLIGG